MSRQLSYEENFNNKSGVVSLRTRRIKELKSLANEMEITISQLSSDIIDEYLEFKELTTKYRMHRESKKVYSYVYEFLDESAIKKVIDLSVEEAIDAIKTMTNDFSLASILNLIKKWAKFNDISIEEFSEESCFKFVCKNNMSLNWNKSSTKVFIKIFEHFGFSGTEDFFKEGMFSVKISKYSEKMRKQA